MRGAFSFFICINNNRNLCAVCDISIVPVVNGVHEHVKAVRIIFATARAGVVRDERICGVSLDDEHVVERPGRGEKRIAKIAARGRLQYDHVNSSLGVERNYFSLGGSGTYRVNELFVVEGGLTYRMGDVSGTVASDSSYDDVIFHLGAVVTY